jgi:hypothetical protein
MYVQIKAKTRVVDAGMHLYWILHTHSQYMPLLTRIPGGQHVQKQYEKHMRISIYNVDGIIATCTYFCNQRTSVQ